MLKFEKLSDVVEDARRLHSLGYEQLGNWDLAQVCGHLEDWMRFPVEGFPKAPFPVNVMLWMMKLTIGKSTLRKMLETETMKEAAPTMPSTVKAFDAVSSEKAIKGLEQAIQQFEAHQGDYIPSPLFGQMTREQAMDLQKVHCSHHFSFLLPKDTKTLDI